MTDAAAGPRSMASQMPGPGTMPGRMAGQSQLPVWFTVPNVGEQSDGKYIDISDGLSGWLSHCSHSPGGQPAALV